MHCQSGLSQVHVVPDSGAPADERSPEHSRHLYAPNAHSQHATHLLRSVVSVTSDVTVADTTHYLETECMREAMEQVLYSNGVDVVLNGHLHEYERTNPVFVSHLPPCLLCAFNTEG